MTEKQKVVGLHISVPLEHMPLSDLFGRSYDKEELQDHMQEKGYQLSEPRQENSSIYGPCLAFPIIQLSSERQVGSVMIATE